MYVLSEAVEGEDIVRSWDLVDIMGYFGQVWRV